MYRKRIRAFLLVVLIFAMTIAPVSAEGLLDPPTITMTIVGEYVFSNDIPKPYCQSLNGLFYDGKSLAASDYSLLEPQEQYPDERLFIRIPLSHGKQDGTVALLFKAVGYRDTMATFTFPADPDPQSQPSAPELLSATALSDVEVKITWKSTSQWKAFSYRLVRKQPGGFFVVLEEVDGTKLSYVDASVKPDTEYIYSVQMNSVDGVNSEYSNDLSVKTKAKTATVTPPATPLPAVTQPVITNPVQPQQPQTPAAGKKELRFYVGSGEYFIDNKLSTMDTTPIVSEGRTLLPIKYATEPLGATVDWNAAEKKVTIKTKAKTIELWIGKNTAKINGAVTQIDPGNPAVQPVIVPPGRTMLPLRFVTENLGCDLEWNPATKEVKITAK